MINALLRLTMLGCQHRKTTFPITSGRCLDRTYVVCLDCGMEFEYDWKAMKRGAPVGRRRRGESGAAGLLHAPDLTRRAEG